MILYLLFSAAFGVHFTSDQSACASFQAACEADGDTSTATSCRYQLELMTTHYEHWAKNSLGVATTMACPTCSPNITTGFGAQQDLWFGSLAAFSAAVTPNIVAFGAGTWYPRIHPTLNALLECDATMKMWNWQSSAPCVGILSDCLLDQAAGGCYATFSAVVAASSVDANHPVPWDMMTLPIIGSSLTDTTTWVPTQLPLPGLPGRGCDLSSMTTNEFCVMTQHGVGYGNSMFGAVGSCLASRVGYELSSCTPLPQAYTVACSSNIMNCIIDTGCIAANKETYENCEKHDDIEWYPQTATGLWVPKETNSIDAFCKLGTCALKAGNAKASALGTCVMGVTDKNLGDCYDKIASFTMILIIMIPTAFVVGVLTFTLSWFFCCRRGKETSV